MRHRLMFAIFVTGLSALCAFGQDSRPPTPQAEPPKTVAQAYPTLASAALAYAKPAELPKGVLLRAGEFKVTRADLDA